MVRPVWSGAISFGLVRIPVRLYSATEPKDVRFHEFQRGTDRRIRHRRVAEGGAEEVPYEDVVKGYEVEKDRYVVVTPEELEAVEPDQSRTIEIQDFVDLYQIDPVFFDKTYYLVPQPDAGAERPYGLLHRAMEDAGKVAIGYFVLRTKQYLAAIRPMERVLGLETMLFDDEVRDVDGLLDELELEHGPTETEPSERELKVARQLIDTLTTAWDPARYRDTYRERVLDLVSRKAAGETIAAERPPEAPQAPDIMAALEASVAALRQGRR